ncbi:hypothetical protein SAMN04515674_104241 [Pseudarcicella hirudinis]|uniref:Uncharacterized protein n=1 Tax=Pseudarcicella hirudinis TaxID=1079859 RepID=A0A1I5RVF5_9BACT|nr:hypothetical protein [Pseudarcicella hirudinis]SFP61926.1 hypothetical protein SAMN04515674_104241 [Pseudarcicella hirudinis]
MDQQEILVFALSIAVSLFVSFCAGLLYGGVLLVIYFKRMMAQMTPHADEFMDEIENSGLSRMEYFRERPDAFEKLGKKIDEELVKSNQR